MICKNCGAEISDSALFCRECGQMLKNNNVQNKQYNNSQVDTQYYNCQGNSRSFNDQADTLRENSAKAVTGKKKKDKGITALVIILAAVLIFFSGVMLYIFKNSNDNDTSEADYGSYEKDHKKTEDVAENIKEAEDKDKDGDETNDKDEDGSEEDEDKGEETDTDVITPHATVDNISEEVSHIRELYYALQENIDSCTVYDPAPGVKKYYDTNNNLVRIDVSSNEMDYTRYYYFDNGKLYFAFVFKGVKENRFYIKDDILFRWIDEQGITHDNDIQNSEFISWENVIIEEARKHM